MPNDHGRRGQWVLVALCCAFGLACSHAADVDQQQTAKSTPSDSATMSKSSAAKAADAQSDASAGSAGAGAMDGESGGVVDPSSGPSAAGTTTLPEAGDAPAMDECGLHTAYAGDEYCILPPPPDRGFQLHIGPSNYDNPEPEYILAPGQEITTDFSAVSGNDKPVHFYYRQFRQRPGAHHNIITAGSAGGGLIGGFALGHRIGTSNLLAEDNPKGAITAPENEGVGIPIEAQSPINVSLHSINVSDQPELREVWVNFWYVDESKVTDEAQELFQIGDPLLAVAPGADTILGPYSCAISAPGRMLWFYGHRHANNVRFSAWRVRGDQRDLFYEGLNWEEPLVLEFSTTVDNQTPDDSNGIEGGWSGILDLLPGDRLEWECHVVNQTDGTLRFTNNTYTGEMCIMDGELIGTNCQ